MLSYWPALNVTMHFKQANSVASRRICLNRVTTSCSAWISAMILVIRWDSVFSLFIPVERKAKWLFEKKNKKNDYHIISNYHIKTINLVMTGCPAITRPQLVRDLSTLEEGLVSRSLPETARRVVESTGMAHWAIPRTNSSLQASSRRISCKKQCSRVKPSKHDISVEARRGKHMYILVTMCWVQNTKCW